MSRVPNILLTAALAACLGACASVRPESALPASPAGSWELVSIDGAKLPVVPVDPDRPAEAPPPPEILSGRLVMEPAGTFTQQLEFRFTRGGQPQTMRRDFAGRWVREGTGLVLEWEGAGLTPATVAGDTLTYDNAGMLLRFLRVR